MGRLGDRFFCAQGGYGTVFGSVGRCELHTSGHSSVPMSNQMKNQNVMRKLNNRPRFYQQPRLVTRAVRVEQGFAGTGEPVAFAEDEYIEPADAWE